MKIFNKIPKLKMSNIKACVQIVMSENNPEKLNITSSTKVKQKQYNVKMIKTLTLPNLKIIKQIH